MQPESAFVLCRWLVYGAAMFSWGASGYLAACVPERLARQLDQRLSMPTFTAATVACIATLALLPVRTAMVANGWPDAVSISTLMDVVFGTDVGAAWLAQMGAALLMLAARFSGQYRLAGTAVAAGLLLASLTITGHAAMNDGWWRAFHRFTDALHLLSAGAWIGALVPVLLILGHLSRPEREPDARMALMRFSTAGHLAVAIVLISGTFNTLLIVKGLPLDDASPYQRLLVMKVALVAAMVTLAIINRYVVVPQLKPGRKRSTQVLYIATLAEILLAVVVLGLVAWFGTIDPR